MRRDRSLRFMASTLNAKASMEIQECGRCSLTFLITCRLVQSLMRKCLLFMEDCLPLCTRLTILELFKEFRRYLMKVHMLIWCGATQILINLALASQLEEQGTSSVKTFVCGSFKRMAWKQFTELTNFAKTDTKLCSMDSSPLFGVHLITATDMKT